jgi:beta-glucanase (GH16 family)
MQLVWNDEFNIDGPPDPANWTFEQGFVRNRELQWYQPANAVCREGRLLIEGRRERIENPAYNARSDNWRENRKYAEYTSSCLLTRGLHEWPVSGHFEIRARLDTTGGAWPAIWMLGSSGRWPYCGEIDIMEFYRINGIPTILANAAWGSDEIWTGKWDSVKKPLSEFLAGDPDWTAKYHIWTMDWDEEAIRICIDGSLANEILLEETLNPDGTNPFSADRQFYILLNLALGSNGGEPADVLFPVAFEVDYVRVYTRKPGDL